MAEEMRSPINVLMACRRLEAELPSLLYAEAWARIEPEFHDKMAKLETSMDASQQRVLSVELILLLARNEQVKKRLDFELHFQEVIKTGIAEELNYLQSSLGADNRTLRASLDAAALGMSWSLDSDELPSVDVLKTRLAQGKTGGIGGLENVKFRSLNLDFGEMSLITGGVFLAGHEILKEPNGFMIAASALTTIAALYKATTVKIREQEAIVFWSFIQARGKDNTATESAIVASTKQECDKHHREPLSDAVIQRALINLEALKSVARVDGKPDVWKLIEQFKIKL